MFRVPKIVVTNIDEDPNVRKQSARKRIIELCGKKKSVFFHFNIVFLSNESKSKLSKSQSYRFFLVVGGMILTIWILVIGKSCLIYGLLIAIILTIIIIIQYVFFIKTSWAVHFGAKRNTATYYEPIFTLRWTLARIHRFTAGRRRMISKRRSNQRDQTSCP